MTYQFSENREKYLGMGESAAGFGTMMGPVMAGLLYYYMGYFGAFMAFAGFVLIAATISYLCISNDLNCSLDAENDLEKAFSAKF
jgi:MFS family permease